MWSPWQTQKKRRSVELHSLAPIAFTDAYIDAATADGAPLNDEGFAVPSPSMTLEPPK